MRFDFLKQDTLYFRDHFPAENYNAFSTLLATTNAESIEHKLGLPWEKGSGVQANFFEALAWLRSDDFLQYEGFKSYSLNEHDTEYTYDNVIFQEWVIDEYERFDVHRHASAIYNLPIRIVDKLNMDSIDKYRQAEYVLKYIDEYMNKEQNK